MIRIKILDEVKFQFFNVPKNITDIMKQKFAYIKPKFDFIKKQNTVDNIISKRLNSGFKPGKKINKEVLVDFKNNVTFNYLLSEFIAILDNADVEYEVDTSLLSQIHEDIIIPDLNTIFEDYDFSLRDYQKDCINVLISNRTGFIVAATAAGKSAIMAALAKIFRMNNKRCLFVVPNVDLVTQTKATFNSLNVECGELYAKKKDIDADILITTRQSLANYEYICKDYDMMLVDEGHTISADSLQKIIIHHCNHMQFRFACTGTFPKVEYFGMLAKCLIGDVAYTVNASELIEAGFLSSVEIHPTRILFALDEKDEFISNHKFMDYAAERTFMANHEIRHAAIADFIEETISKADMKNSLILVQNVKQGEFLAKYLDNAIFISGASKGKDRLEVYDSFKDSDSIKAIATYGIASTGISINRIFNIFLIDIGKSFTKVIQTIGRGLRKSIAEDKFHVNVYDLVTPTSAGANQFSARRKFYAEANYPTNRVKTLKILMAEVTDEPA